MSEARQRMHGTAVAAAGRAALIIGPSGAGKSDLALRAIGHPVHDGRHTHHVRLVADDQVIVEQTSQGLRVSAPSTIAGQIEVRGLGIVRLPYDASAELALVVELAPQDQIQRLPDARFMRLLGQNVQLVALDPTTAGAVVRLVLALIGAERVP